jgi:N utilization substance protein A
MLNDEAESVTHAFMRHVPEIAAGTVAIKAVVRKPGIRTKVALASQDPLVDCIGVSVGIRGSRIKNVVDELDGERIDLVRWDDRPENVIRSALQPCAIEDVRLRPTEHSAVVFVKPDQLSLAVGRRGENLELACQLCGWDIKIIEQRPSSA